jgi:dynein heavy chain, axonemal
MRILDCFMNNYKEDDVKKVSKEMIENLSGMIKQLFFFAMIWSIGATTDAVGRERFSGWIREKLKKENVAFPEENLVYDFNFNVKSGEWDNWFKTIESYTVDTRLPFNEIVVPTQDSIRMKHLAKMMIANGKHVLMPGPIGTGKSSYIS